MKAIYIETGEEVDVYLESCIYKEHGQGPDRRTFDLDELEFIPKENEFDVLSNLGNSKIQDILEEMGMLDENGYCPHTAEEIFRAGVEWTMKRK